MFPILCGLNSPIRRRDAADIDASKGSCSNTRTAYAHTVVVSSCGRMSEMILIEADASESINGWSILDKLANAQAIFATSCDAYCSIWLLFRRASAEIASRKGWFGNSRVANAQTVLARAWNVNSDRFGRACAAIESIIGASPNFRVEKAHAVFARAWGTNY